MSPASFSRKPLRWLQAITNYSHLGTIVSGGAFSIDHNNEEVLVLVYELQRKYRNKANPDEIKFVIKDAFAKKDGLAIHDVVLIETSSFPKTSSGKLQRRLAKAMYLNKELKIIK